MHAGAPDFCFPHEFADEPGMLFCVNQGFSGTSYAEFENIEEAAMNCIGMELAEECQPALIAWCATTACRRFRRRRTLSLIDTDSNWWHDAVCGNYVDRCVSY